VCWWLGHNLRGLFTFRRSRKMRRGFESLLSAPHPGCEILGPDGPAGGRSPLRRFAPNQRDLESWRQVCFREVAASIKARVKTRARSNRLIWRS
jgi:hypothetical protein